jgi:predicted membrane metal-binding protein
MRGGLHENLESRTADGPGSERGFAIVFAVVFVLVGLWPLLSGGPVRAWALLVAAAFLLAGFAAPGILAPLNRLWFRFGMALGRIVSPVVMGILFFGTVMPTGLLMRLFRKDLLRLRFDPAAESYWIPRDPPGPSAESLKQQF